MNSSVQHSIQIRPLRIEPLDQVKLPPALPLLQLLFACDSFIDTAVVLKDRGKLKRHRLGG